MKWCPLECWGQESNHYLGQQSVDECVDWNQQTKYPWFKYCSKLSVQIYSRKTCPSPIRKAKISLALVHPSRRTGSSHKGQL